MCRSVEIGDAGARPKANGTVNHRPPFIDTRLGFQSPTMFSLFAFRLELTWGLIENQTLIDDCIPLLLRQGIRAGCTS
jgi:hypothetical protein